MDRSTRALQAAILLSMLLSPSLAQGQVDVQDVSFLRGVDRIDGGVADESAFAAVVLVGDGITSADLIFPNLSVSALTGVTAREFRLDLALDDEADLSAEFPAGGYGIDINSGELLLTLDHTVPAVPAPAISSPVHGSANNSPTTSSFSFTGCPGGVCSESTDHGFAEITEGAMLEANAFLPAGASSYAPPELSEDADLTFLVDNVAYRVGFEIEDGDPFTFFQSFAQSDSVDFSTGFKGIDEAPLGAFVIAVPDPANGLLDPSGNVNTTLANVGVGYTFTVAPSGKVSGTGNADVDNNGSFETPATLKGKLKGKNGILDLKVTLQIKSKEPGTEASAKYTRAQQITAATGNFTGSELLKGLVLGVKVEASAPLAGNIATPTNWQLDFDSSTIDGRTLMVSGSFSPGAGGSIPLTGSGKYNSAKGTSAISLKSGGDDKGASFKLKDITVDSMGNIAGGTLSYKAYGQSGSVVLP